jgi:hypothetical protein
MCVSSHPTTIAYGFPINLLYSDKIIKLYATLFRSGVQVSDSEIRIKRIEVTFFRHRNLPFENINYQDT